MIQVGGWTSEGVAQFGHRLGMVPAKRVPEAARRLLELYRTERQGKEGFRQWVERVRPDRLKNEMNPFRTLPPFEQAREMYEDLGAQGALTLEVGTGECAT